jgi:hypothetical protein
MLRLHAMPALKLVTLVLIAALTVRYSADFCDTAAEMWTARFGDDAQKTALVRHYQQQAAARHGWRIWSVAELRKRFAAHGIPDTMLSDAVVSR